MLKNLLYLTFTIVVVARRLPPIASIDDDASPDFTTFTHPIRKVAVIGAGPSGLQAAAALINHGFEVRLFERKRRPGGIWYPTNTTALPVHFPNPPLERAAYEPDIPAVIPSSRIYTDGDDGLSNIDRLREHWNPSPVWDHLTANSPPSITSMPGIEYPPETPWAIPHQALARNMRQYATLMGLNSDDSEPEYPNITSYSTRVEKIYKAPGSRTWTVTLRKLEVLPYTGGKLRAAWWTEDFDAVVVSTGDFDAPYVPDTPGLAEWARAYPERIYHARQYRSPEAVRGKNVLIVGGAVSASEIARDISTIVKGYSISHTPNFKNIFKRRSFLRLPKNITHLPRIASYSPVVDPVDPLNPLSGLEVTLENGTTLGGFEEIIFCTGYRRSNPFLVGFHNTSIKGTEEPETDVAPIITNGLFTRNLHWTGHYIDDPTLAFTQMLRSFTQGQYQSLGIAKVWSNKARLPSRAKMWETYPGPQKDIYQLGPFVSLAEEATNRLWIAWLNAASLQFGGEFVAPWPTKGREEFVYFAEKYWEPDYARMENFTEFNNVPQAEWPTRNEESILHHVGANPGEPRLSSKEQGEVGAPGTVYSDVEQLLLEQVNVNAYNQ